MYKKFFLVFIIFMITLSGFLFYKAKNSNPTPSGQTYEVVLDENGFLPEEITLKPGDSVRFTTKLNEPFWPASDLHPTHGIYPEFDPQQPLDPQSSWTFQFLKNGKWKYHDHLQPIFKGTIKVI